ncbi:hypothetical protein DL770_002749 [Monosporascus sp. CRB-9-2]|nr:hypothetical protein DL770_002749 [Monosporascus sp. CRB-9-2]
MLNGKEPVAIIGSGCRFPGGVNTPSGLWDLLRDPHDLLSRIPEERFSAKGFYHQDGQYHGHSNAVHAHLLSGNGVHRRFDARFFGINPAEANALDPQMRLLLETVYEALESSGLTINALQGSDTAIYTGQMVGDYEHTILRDEDSISTYHGSGTARSLTSNRVSYFFDWRGPSMTIDTACSSSLVAVHQAVQQLRSGESRVAVAAGANLILDPQPFISFSNLRLLSPEGRSRMWDASANGYGRGEGIAAVVLKTLSAAEADGDHIDCIIRETGVNQDGKTPGIMVPSSTAQTKLIKGCYARAGLDLANVADRPQYFEAHGDPVEAEAISSAFFPPSNATVDGAEPLLVGSIKTVIGHTEGTAGLAGLLKVSLALQNKTVPPNLLFNRLNPRIQPFYSNLRIPTSVTDWPPTLGPRRASVNSFGFGGTNAHAILESYEPAIQSNVPNFLPFVFSAASESSLSAYLDAFCVYLRENKTTVSLRDLAYTLYSRRTRFQLSTSMAANTVDDMCAKLESKLQSARANADEPIGHKSLPKVSHHKPRILGLFTGQGAQWPQQGLELMAKSATAYRVLENLERRLSQLPPGDRPSWSLVEEIQKNGPLSRIHQAELSQPLCTATQILQVDLLRAAGVDFCAVVGHSSGEIAAAYAAGRISAEDAICIAYYRGRYSSLAQGLKGQLGAMMAVSTSFEDVKDLCESPEFKGRICVAAINSVTSVTVSGDKDAIEELQDILHDEKKFTRILKVDKAYHSHHMNACSFGYLRALEALRIRVRSSSKCAWFSSVYECDMSSIQEALQSEYWNSNLGNPVLFMQALRLACSSQEPFDLAIEIGPHPALKGPALQTINDAIPYTGLFHRGRSSVETFAEALGFIWLHLGQNAVDFGSYGGFLSGTTTNRLIKGLPPYSWDHSHQYWHESRYARARRSRPSPVHPLLGHRTPDSTGQDIRWRQILRPKEISWLKGHRLQGQIVFPAAGYVVLALEAALSLCQGTPISLVDVANLEILKALTFDHDEAASMEAVFSLAEIARDGDRFIDASFKYHASDETRGDSLDLLVSGRIRVILGESTSESLPARRPRPTHLYPVKADEFYASMRDLDYQYSPPFTGLSGLERRLGVSTGFISNVQTTDFLVHPAVLDAAFQSIFLAQSFPNDGGIWALHVPKTIRNVRVNPGLCSSAIPKSTLLSFDSLQPENIQPFSGDVDIYAESIDHAIIQVEGLTSVPLARTIAMDDRELFATTIWSVASPDAEQVMRDDMATPRERELACTLERTAMFYLRNLDRVIPSDHPCRADGPVAGLFRFASHVLTMAGESKLAYSKMEWEFDTLDKVAMACQRYPGVVEVELLQAIGDNMVDIVKGTKKAIEIGMENQLLERYYAQALDMSVFTKYLATITGQITHRYPHLHILEVGAGTGSATRGIFQEIGQAFASYTFTDISSGFFDRARDVFSREQSKMAFKVLDIDYDPCSQGFSEHSYDLVVASMVLHTTRFMVKTLQNVRRLLKPGGYLVVLEGLPDSVVRLGMMFGAFPGWWAGSHDGRVLSPFIALAEWDRLLRATGFSGCDTVTDTTDTFVMPLTVFVSQAMDTRISFLRNPIPLYQGLFDSGDLIRNLVLIGFLRSSLREIPTLDSQSLDIERAQDIQASLIFESILRLNAIKMWQREGTAENMLTTAEPDVRLNDPPLFS